MNLNENRANNNVNEQKQKTPVETSYKSKKPEPIQLNAVTANAQKTNNKSASCC